MKNQISAKIVADSINQQGDRITTMEIVFPRMILAEYNTHRLFSRNSASSRAIPFKKMVEMVKNTPFIPIAWQKDHSGMQGTQYFEGWRAKILELAWIAGSKTAVFAATKLHKLGLTKQLCNRLLEPFMYHKVLVTFTESENFFKLRCPQYSISKALPDYYNDDNVGRDFKSWSDIEMFFNIDKSDDGGHTASSRKALSRLNRVTEIEKLKCNSGMGEIHIMDLAEKMWDAMDESTPVQLKPGEWHIPYGDNITFEDTYPFDHEGNRLNNEKRLKIAIARCARLSYQTLGDNPKIDYEADLKLFEVLKNSGHFSPFEHVARCMSEDEYYQSVKGNRFNNKELNDSNYGWCGNFKGFVQYRYLLES